METFSLKIISSDKIFYEGPCQYLTVPAPDGQKGVLPHHENMVIAVDPGELHFKTPDGEWVTAAVSMGFAEIMNNRVSVLVGDYMLATSLKHASHTGMVRLVELVACLGQDLSEGEILQLTNIENNDFSEQAYFDVIRKKTAALFRASAESGAISVQAGEEDVRCASLFGEMIGIAFQIKDDIFDYFDNPQIGKPTGNDMMEGKLTLPAIYVLNKLNSPELDELALRIRNLEASKEEVASFVERIKSEGGIGYAEKVMRDYRDKALALLPDFTGNELRESLTAYIDYVVERDK